MNAGAAMPQAAPREAMSARAALQAATREVHERLHGVPALQRLADGRITRAEYAALLRRMLSFHAAIEARLAEGPSLEAFGIAVAERVRSRQIRDDLAMLGETADAPPPARALPALRSPAEALGFVYVTEGATLGGKLLARALVPLLGDGEEGRRFLLGYGARSGAMWRSACDAIEAGGATEPNRAAMIAAAIAAFACFEATVA